MRFQLFLDAIPHAHRPHNIERGLLVIVSNIQITPCDEKRLDTEQIPIDTGEVQWCVAIVITKIKKKMLFQLVTGVGGRGAGRSGRWGSCLQQDLDTLIESILAAVMQASLPGKIWQINETMISMRRGRGRRGG